MEVKYSQPPIEEAIIDIRVAKNEGLKVEDLAENPDEDIFDDVSELNLQTIETSASPKSFQSRTEKECVGYCFKAKDWVLQFRLDGLTITRLKPYCDWENFQPFAEKLWKQYVRKNKNVTVSQIGIRYINRLILPIDKFELENYLRTMPVLSGDLPDRKLSNFFMQLQLPQNDLKGIAILNIGTSQPLSPTEITIILDIDVIRPNLEVKTDDEIWDIVETLHKREKKIFESSITNKLRHQFNG